MYAIVRAGAKQEKVAVGDVIEIDKVSTPVGDTLTLPVVLAVDGDKVTATGLDKAAVHETRDQHSLIRALALLASPFDPRSPVQGAATAYDGSPLVGRAERIAALGLELSPARPGRHIAVALGVALAALCALPVVSAAPRLTDYPADPAMLPVNSSMKKIVDVEERSTTQARRIVTVIQ